VSGREESPFDAVPEIYDRIRPSYPEALFDALFGYAAAGGRAPTDVLEIGAGTGQATAALLARRAHVTAVELGPNIAAYLARKFADEPRLNVLTGAFEAIDLLPASFDLVLTATAFHWLAPGVRVAKPAELLRAGGVFAVVDTMQVASPADRGYFAASQPIYDRYFRGEDPGELLDPGAVEPAALAEIRESGLFEDVRLWRFRWDQRYETARYIDLVRSYSGTNRMPLVQREAFLAELATFIDREYEGYVLRPLVMTLVAARVPKSTRG